ncbi:double-strand break repair protein AddB [Methylorubrum populi BJ001]|jgi:ATP-dependent helicase/nuclease subunit B|uniref:Double-strand break repair protein AddB n=1 Tax=Methylorubrum populi (strain ATCC BAA-705 / NCIMB 13946 / BJ001) TaxID=441620 RepID=B1ZLY0_METPB|nr:double-strand break repair protein AddB [Methylorubrum populi]ACB83049.1 double-strand break repair protein AddB [Methylorubrum populi BJ001]OAH30868.1 double-strand break repair protein AddB [Methylorubrum populi]PZP71045.1 MAG: double-strand break repair protein AddB [Methylorubrum populi]
MSATAAPRVFTIPPGAPFLPTLADALVSGRLVGAVGHDPFALASVTLYLPTQRAVRALSTVLAQRLGGAALLPRMIPLGEADEAELDLSASTLLDTPEDLLHPSIPALERRLILARLVQKWAETVDRELLPIDDEVPFLVPSSPADAVALAADLEGLMDALTVEGLPWSEIASAVEAEHSRYFRLTLDFLRIAAEHWPEILAARSLADPTARARRLVLAEADRLTRDRPDDPMIVAGSTGSVPATARLIAAVARLPRGAVVLPGLDLHLDEEGWEAIDGAGGTRDEIAHGHPQAILRALTGRTGLAVARGEVETLGTLSPEAVARERLLSQALRPAETTDAWARLDGAERLALAHEGMEGLAVVEAADEREEALVAALALRETLETPGATAALVTPDRGLALRVSAELARWGIAAEDSAGLSLARSQAGRFARLVAELAAEVAPARVIALLAHPFVRLGLTRSEVVRAAAALEIGGLRGPAPIPKNSFDGMRAAVALQRNATERVPRAKKRLKAIDWDLSENILDRLEIALDRFRTDLQPAIGNLVALAALHREACERMMGGAETEEEIDDPSLDTLDGLFDDLESAEQEALPGRFSDYAAFFTALARDRTVACAQGNAHPRLRILGPLEARLLSVDRIVLGGLDEAVWPVRQTTDAFLNRPMRGQVGLSPPERRIGQAAHDFVQGLGIHDAVVTRAAKREGSPTVPSRFLQRLRAFGGDAVWAGAIARGQRLRGLAAILDRGREAPPPRLTRPAPKPDPALFPSRLSVTEIETLVRDPYSIFARHILGLEALEPMAVVPGAAERGSLIHKILGDFSQAHPGPLPADAETLLYAIALDAFGPLQDQYPELYAEWFPRYERMAVAFLEWEASQRQGLRAIHAERSGKLTIPLGERTFTLSARADRIEVRADGGYCIVDFKTGTPPSNRTVFAGFSPQLTLEAAMLMHGAFEGLKAASAPDLLYVHASGGREPFRPIPVKAPPGDARAVAAIVEEHLERLRGLIARYMTGEAAYPSRPYPQYVRAYNEYDHLARVLEWSLAGEGEAA